MKKEKKKRGNPNWMKNFNKLIKVKPKGNKSSEDYKLTNK